MIKDDRLLINYKDLLFMFFWFLNFGSFENIPYVVKLITVIIKYILEAISY